MTVLMPMRSAIFSAGILRDIITARRSVMSAGVIDDSLDANAVGYLQRGNIARHHQGAAQRDVAFKLLIVVVRRVEAGGSGEAHRLVEDDIVGRGALVDRGGVNIGLEGRADLAHRLSGAVELGVFEISPADHRFDLTTGVVDGNEGPLGA